MRQLEIEPVRKMLCELCRCYDASLPREGSLCRICRITVRHHDGCVAKHATSSEDEARCSCGGYTLAERGAA